MSQCLICNKRIHEQVNINELFSFKSIRLTQICQECCCMNMFKKLLKEYMQYYDYIKAKQVGELLYELKLKVLLPAIFLCQHNMIHEHPVIDETAELLRHLPIKAYHIDCCLLPVFPVLSQQKIKKRVANIVILTFNGIESQRINSIYKQFPSSKITILTLQNML